MLLLLAENSCWLLAETVFFDKPSCPTRNYVSCLFAGGLVARWRTTANRLLKLYLPQVFIVRPPPQFETRRVHRRGRAIVVFVFGCSSRLSLSQVLLGKAQNVANLATREKKNEQRLASLAHSSKH